MMQTTSVFSHKRLHHTTVIFFAGGVLLLATTIALDPLASGLLPLAPSEELACEHGYATGCPIASQANNPLLRLALYLIGGGMLLEIAHYASHKMRHTKH